MHPGTSPYEEPASILEEVQSQLRLAQERIAELEEEKRQLQIDQQLFLQLMDHIPDKIYFKNKESQFFRVSQSLASSHGVETAENAIGQTDFDFFDPENAKHKRHDEEVVMKQHKPIIGKVEKEEWAHGLKRWVSTSKLPLFNSEKELIGTFGISRDITDLVETQAALRKSETSYQILVEQMPWAVFRKDKSGKYEYCNQSFGELLGLPREEIVGKKTNELYSEEQAKVILEDDETIFENGELLDTIDEIEQPGSGKTIFVRLLKTAIRDERGEIIGLLGMARDVTSEQRAEKAVNFLAAFFEVAQEAITVTDLEGHLLSWNPGAEKIYGYQASEIIGQHVSILAPEELRRETKAIIQQITAGEILPPFRTQRRSKTGQMLEVMLSLAPIRSSDGEILGIAGISRDVTQEMLDKKSARHWNALFQLDAFPLIQLSLEGLIESWNDAAASLYGFSLEEVKGEHVSILLAEEDREAIYSQLGTVLMKEVVSRVPMTHLNQAKEPISVKVTMTAALETPADRIEGILMISEFCSQ
ncbi:Hypothetical protein PBC10988_8820 [Planctomycetales bacterium 10988]|nr:Hypothetical protein PBC10988_8820 [Planctomycetales bacterium 10988]